MLGKHEHGVSARNLIFSGKESAAELRLDVERRKEIAAHEQSNFQGEYIEPSLLATLRRFEQSRGWQIGGGGLFSFGWNHSSRLMLHCGPSFKSPREAFEGERCFGVLLRFDLGRRKLAH